MGPLRVAIVLSMFLWSACAAVAAAPSPPTAPFVLGPPDTGGGPVVVEARFDLGDLNRIDEESEIFEFTGILTLRWKDPRSAFDPAEAGVPEKFYLGAFQFNEISPGWYPQAVLVNEAGMFEKSGTLLRVLPDGTSTLVETIVASATSDLGMRRYPFDRHRLEATFLLIGFDAGEAAFAVADGAAESVSTARLSQWKIDRVALATGERAAPPDGALASTLAVGIEVRRVPFYVMRLIVVPLALIVLLSFSVFWMDRSSLGDRINVSFIGILTAVAYQIVISDKLPRISYVTLIHGFLMLSFMTMCATVVVNLAVGEMDKRKRFEAGDRIDRTCRWLFPALYFGTLVVIGVSAFLVFGADAGG